MPYSITTEPSSSHYKEAGHDGLRLFQVDSGPPRLRKDKARSNPVVDLVWNVFYLDFIRLMSAYRNGRHEEWEISFVSLETGYGTYLCRLHPGSFSWRPNGETGYSVSCTVEVMGSVS